MNISQVKEIKNNKILAELIKKYQDLDNRLKIINPKVNKIKNDLLSKYSFDEKNRDGSRGKRITNPDRLYRSIDNTDDYFKEYNFIISKQEYSKGLKYGYCPQSTLEYKKIMLEKEIEDIVIKTFNMPEIYDIKLRKELFNITLKFIS